MYVLIQIFLKVFDDAIKSHKVYQKIKSEQLKSNSASTNNNSYNDELSNHQDDNNTIKQILTKQKVKL